MTLVLTENSSLACAHLGAVTLTATTSKLTVAGARVLVDGDLSGALINGCSTVPVSNPPTLKCLSIVTVEGGVSSKLKVAGKGVLLETVKGKTNGTISGVVQTWSVQTVGQSKLKAP
jgi:hypothetical protein